MNVNIGCEIKQAYNADLLNMSLSTFTAKDILDVYLSVKNKLHKKVSYNTKRQERFNALEKEFLDLYERVKEKEKKAKGEDKNITKEPLYSPWVDNSSYREVWFRLKYKAPRNTKKLRKYNKIQKIRGRRQ